MPINPSIPLESKAAEVQPLSNQYAQALGIKNQQQAGQIQQQQLQENDLKIQQQQRQQQDALTISRIWKEHQGDVPKTLAALKASDVSPETQLAMQESIDKAATAHAQNGLTTINLQSAREDKLIERLDGFSKLPPDQQASLWPSFVKSQADAQLITPEEAQQHTQYQGPDTAKHYLSLLNTSKYVHQQALAKIAEDKARADVEHVQAETDALKTGGNVNWQDEDVLLDNKPAKVLRQPKTNQYKDLSGNPIENAAQRIKPKPTTQTPLATPPAAEIDLTPPTGPSANKPDPTTGRTPNAIHQDAIVKALEGKMPQVGLGSSPTARAIRDAVSNRAAALAQAAGTDEATLKSEYDANRATLVKLAPQYRATAVASGTATDNLQLALGKSEQIARTNAKFVNKYAQWAQGNFTKAAGLTEFETYIYTAAREYAKVTSGGAASAQGLTDSAAKEAEKLLNSAQSPAAFAAAVNAMTKDMGNVVANQEKGLAKVAPAVANFLAVANGRPPITAAAETAPPATNGPKVGERRTANGETREWTGSEWKPVAK